MCGIQPKFAAQTHERGRLILEMRSLDDCKTC